jgi:sterol desaturase/sphingolipid hydroxylase (fatty acid hydroxylase superfamily)
MHKIVAFRPIHKAHHQYKNIVLPSNDNAVSANEFLFAYMLPFVTGCVFFRPTSFGLMWATLIVSGFKLLVHSNVATMYKRL